MASKRREHHPRARQCVGGDWKNRTNTEWDVSSPTLTSICTVSSARPGWDSPRATNTHTSTVLQLWLKLFGATTAQRAFLRVQRLGPLVVEMVCCSWAVATGDMNQQSWSRKSKIRCGTHWISKISLIIHIHHDKKETGMLLRKHLRDNLRKVIYDSDTVACQEEWDQGVFCTCGFSANTEFYFKTVLFSAVQSASVISQSSPRCFPVTNTLFSHKTAQWLRHKSLYQARIANLGQNCVTLAAFWKITPVIWCIAQSPQEVCAAVQAKEVYPCSTDPCLCWGHLAETQSSVSMRSRVTVFPTR